MTQSSGAAADVTLTGVTPGKYGSFAYAVGQITITGRSSQPFAYDGEDDFAVQYADGPDPWHPDNSNIWNPDIEAGFPPALRAGTLSNGQTVSGTLAFHIGSHGGRLLISAFDDGNPRPTTPLAQWLVDNPSPGDI
ncbi:hypothetical protein [Pseudonocardia dioxanivorans]|uniref:hypothetical protein n=1 Tax=Pseudonocardia dioxanivorans TaxID=240495 RepID=UPI00131A56AE|nr:hypothetical protein [Pseudonocardia dioxanivorans]